MKKNLSLISLILLMIIFYGCAGENDLLWDSQRIIFLEQTEEGDLTSQDSPAIKGKNPVILPPVGPSPPAETYRLHGILDLTKVMKSISPITPAIHAFQKSTEPLLTSPSQILEESDLAFQCSIFKLTFAEDSEGQQQIREEIADQSFDWLSEYRIDYEIFFNNTEYMMVVFVCSPITEGLLTSTLDPFLVKGFAEFEKEDGYRTNYFNITKPDNIHINMTGKRSESSQSDKFDSCIFLPCKVPPGESSAISKMDDFYLKPSEELILQKFANPGQIKQVGISFVE